MTEAELQEQVMDLDMLSMEATGQTMIYDSREVSRYIDKLKISRHLTGFKFIRKTLPVGDYIVNGTLIERKTRTDLLDSIYKGARLNNQLCEMSRNCEISVLVITGNPYEVASNPVDEAVLTSAITGAWFRSAIDGKGGIVIVQALKDEEPDTFAEFLKLLSKKDPIRRLKLAKSKVSDSDHMVLTLMTVPGWGEMLARAGLEMYGFISRMMELTEKELAEVDGVGKGKAKVFHEHFRREYES